jgi:hypothetical protein
MLKYFKRVGLVFIALIVPVIYFPAFRLEFYLDDWSIMEMLGKLGSLEFILRSLNPLTPDFLNTYRPLQGVVLGIEYVFIGPVPFYYHFFNIILHMANCIVLGLLIFDLTRNYRLALVVEFFYASLPIYSLAVFLLSATDALATLFYLLALYCWQKYLKTELRKWFVLCFLSFGLGLASKEFVVTLPAVCVLIDLLILKQPFHLGKLIQRYAGFGIVVLLYVAFELNIYLATANYRAYRTSLGEHIWVNGIRYVEKVIVPWNASLPSFWQVLLIPVGIGLLYKKTYRPLFIFAILWAALNISPVLGFQAKFDARFLYLAGVASALWLALMVEWFLSAVKNLRIATWLTSGALGLLLVFNATGINALAAEYAEDSRAQKVPFRDIARQHPSFPQDTYLYFIGLPVSLRDLSGMLYLRYGANVSVHEPFNNVQVQLAQHANPIIYYFDETGKPIEVSVSTASRTRISPAVPIAFENGILLHDYEISSDTLKPGKDMVLILYWGTTLAIQNNYKIFVHLVDRNGNMIEGVDGPPAMGKAPTSTWKIGQMITDNIIIPIPKDVSPQENCRLEIGLYDFSTGQRLAIVNDHGSPATSLEISPVHIR